jgi:putative CocE/NonD family hydrolase
MKIVKNFPRKVREIANQWIPMADGVRLAARIWLPADALVNRVPAILEYLPYRKRDGTVVRDQLTHPYFAGHGYAAVRVDMRGNGDSEGLMFDEYTKQEQDDAVAVIAWLARQPWCTGRVGMMGISWGGFNALQVAARRPPALKAIITLCSTDDRYSDDIHYKGGCLLTENLGWAATMFAYSSRPPDPAIVGKSWKRMWLERLKNQPFLISNWLKHPHRDDYWKHGSVCENWSAIEAAALCVGGWNDAYSNSVPRLILGLKSPSKAIIGPWAHKYPHFAVPEPRIGFLQEALRWWDFWLKGEPTRVLGEPNFRTYIMDVMRPSAAITHVPGRWVKDHIWPSDSVQRHRLYLKGRSLDREPGAPQTLSIRSPQATGVDGGEFCIIWLGPEFPGDQRRDDAGSLTFDSEALADGIDLVGAPMLHLSFSVDKPVAFVAVRLNSLWPDGASSRISYGILNLCHRDSHEHPSALEPHRRYSARVKLDDIAMHIPKDHRLRLSISTCYWPMVWPAPEEVTLSVHTEESHLEIPVRGRRPEDTAPDFAEAEAAPPLRRREIQKPSNKREITIDQASGETRLTIVDDFGRYEIVEHGLTSWECAREIYTIMPDDPLSARQEIHWSEELSRGRWKVRTETYSELTATREHWLIKGRLEAYEGRRRILARRWREKIERKLS